MHVGDGAGLQLIPAQEVTPRIGQQVDHPVGA
jgi:hypothetical protein